MTKFSDDIKKIVGVDRDKASDINLVDQGGIPSVRGIGTQSNGGATSSTATGGGDENSTTDSGDTTGKTDNTGSGDTGNSNSPNPNNQDSFIRDADSGKFSAESLIDGTDGPSIKTSDLATFQGTGFEGGSLAGLTATDCATGDELDIRIDGLFVPPSATLWPDGSEMTAEWTEASTPPAKVGFVLGRYWGIDPGGGTQQALHPQEAAELAKTHLDANPAGTDTPPYTITGVSQDSSLATRYIVSFSVDDGGSPRTFTLQTNSVGCTDTPPTDPLDCPSTTPTETAWPDDNTISLTYTNGKFIGNSFDNEATAEYLGQDNSSVSFCMPGSRTGLIRAGREGGTVLYETDGSGAPIGVVRYYDSSGAFAGASDTAGYQMFLPPGDS